MADKKQVYKAEMSIEPKRLKKARKMTPGILPAQKQEQEFTKEMILRLIEWIKQV